MVSFASWGCQEVSQLIQFVVTSLALETQTRSVVDGVILTSLPHTSRNKKGNELSW